MDMFAAETVMDLKKKYPEILLEMVSPFDAQAAKWAPEYQWRHALKWSDWLEAHSQAVIMKKGDSLDGEGFSSDPLVVSDSLEAVGQGKATVLTEEGMVLFITID